MHTKTADVSVQQTLGRLWERDSSRRVPRQQLWVSTKAIPSTDRTGTETETRQPASASPCSLHLEYPRALQPPQESIWWPTHCAQSRAPHSHAQKETVSVGSATGGVVPVPVLIRSPSPPGPLCAGLIELVKVVICEGEAMKVSLPKLKHIHIFKY